MSRAEPVRGFDTDSVTEFLHVEVDADIAFTMEELIGHVDRETELNVATEVRNPDADVSNLTGGAVREPGDVLSGNGCLMRYETLPVTDVGIPQVPEEHVLVTNVDIASHLHNSDTLMNKHNSLDVSTFSSMEESVTDTHPLDESLMEERDIGEGQITRSYDSLIGDTRDAAGHFANGNVGADANSVELLEAVCQDGHVVIDGDFVKTDVGSSEVHVNITVQNAEVNREDENLVGNGDILMVDELGVQVERSEAKEHTSAACVSTTSAVMDAGLCVSDLVWGKVKTYPWWPGQIFDRSDASDLALKHRGKGDILVAYFGDRSFAWRDKSQLKPFYANFLHMEKQSSSDAFTNAVEDALEEVSRRMELGLKCSCLPEEDYAAIKYQKVVNAGIRDGIDNSVFDKSVAVDFLKPIRLLQYIKALGQNPTGGSDTLELVTAKAQLKAFYCSKGYPELPEYTFVEVIENDEEISPSSAAKVATEHSTTMSYDLAPGKRNSRRPSKKQKPILEEFSSSSDKIPTELCVEHSTLSTELAPAGKQKRGRQPKEQKYIKEVLSPLLAKKSTKRVVDHSRSLPSELVVKRRRRVSTKSTDAEQGSFPNMKDKNMALALDLDTKSPPPTRSSSFKAGEYIQRVASQLKMSPPFLGYPGETLKSTPWYNSSVDELHSQLCLAASDPLDGYSFLSVLVSFFTVFRNSCASGLPEVSKHGEEMGGHMESVDSESVGFDTSVPDHMKDSYWSDMIISDHSGSGMLSNGLKGKEETDMQRQRKKRKLIRQPSSSCLVGSNINTSQHLQCSTLSPSKDSSASERLIIRVEDKILDTPTALILNFKSLDNLPSQANLINIFCRYGPLRESETEILRKTKRVKIVFKRRADAEKAFSSAGKYSIFGPALVSYKLKYLPPAPEISPGYSTQGGIDAVPIKEHDTVIDQAETGVLSGTLQVEALSTG